MRRQDAGRAGNVPYRRKNPFENRNIILDWVRFWDRYGIEADFSAAAIPKERSFGRVLGMPRGLDLGFMLEISDQKYPVRVLGYEKLGAEVMENERVANESYFIRIRDSREADGELENLSAEMLIAKGVPGVTLLERLVFELKYFEETAGKHLDISGKTLCHGCGNSFGDVPAVEWANGFLNIYRYNEKCVDDLLRGREVVA